MSDAATRPPEQAPDHVLMTWFGTVVTNHAPTDWISHIPWNFIDQSVNPMVVDAPPSGAGDAAVETPTRFLQRRTRPRALPTFVTVPVGDGRYALRCTDTGSGHAQVGRFMVAVPGGGIEVDREHMNEWEYFLPVPLDSLARLGALLASGTAAADGEVPQQLELSHGQVLSAGEHRIDLAQALREPGGLMRDRFTTADGHEVVVVT